MSAPRLHRPSERRSAPRLCACGLQVENRYAVCARCKRELLHAFLDEGLVARILGAAS